MVRSKAFVEVSEDTFSYILQSDHLQIDEKSILDAVYHWGTVNSVVSGKTLGKQVEKVMEHVRFPLLGEASLQTVEEENLSHPKRQGTVPVFPPHLHTHAHTSPALSRVGGGGYSTWSCQRSLWNMYLYTRFRMFLHTHTRIHAYMHAHAHNHVYTHTRSHMYAQTRTRTQMRLIAKAWKYQATKRSDPKDPQFRARAGTHL